MESYATKNKQVSCFVTEEEHDKIKTIADMEDRTISNHVRRTILKDLKLEGSE